MKKILSLAVSLVVFSLSLPVGAQITAPFWVKAKFRAMPERAAEKNREGLEFEPYSADHWYKGNTHCHSDTPGERMFAHGDGPPEATLQWYADNGYDFIALTDHNYFHEGLAAPEGLLSIPSEEITTIRYHVNGLGTNSYIRPAFGEDKVAVYQHAVDETLAQGGVPVLNHPFTPLGFAYPDNLKKIKRLHHFEVYNMQPFNYNRFGEPLWDHLLTDGYLLYGVITDDAHLFAREEPLIGNPPGGGWIMVDADKLTQKAIIEAIREGRFYSSTGVTVKEYEVSADSIRILADEDKTCTIEFIGAFGNVLHSETGSQGTYKVKGDELYVRVRVTDPQGRLALMQPVFYK
jgi:predicted metal-dependent phosphoesterase TrpH